MVLTQIEHLYRYRQLIPALEEVITLFDSLKSYQVGRYELEHGFYMIQRGITKPIEEVMFEAHEKYIDIQYLVQGKELLEWNERSKLVCKKAYDEDKDISLYEGIGTQIKIKEGMCYILWPEDAHKACVHVGQREEYTKIVMKLKVYD
ncbi:YhcH/YjgK/YiaL family protein [Sporanaerobium hydrogeniformans]|uniref:YhcH/YjgK/YiaL family protein n=1 Tax=Sporanaerobium hydrogeniformans TaxID=3072179 RepID=A0AC61DBT5_9FIRM|nr:YhcH/YjgK/YiaL family protein [Sporanaerobium hydrogeniformans]PHV70240.1 YhcH/YjgK/YiaL family protein [Sporanaerobium hydrogeniformans]